MRNVTMTAFLHLNKQKFAFIFKALLIAFAILLTSLYFLPLANKPIFPLLFALHFGLSFLITGMVVTLIFLTGYFYFSRQETIFGSNSLKEFLGKYEFQIDTINSNSKWQLTQRIRTGKVKGYPMVILKQHGKLNSIVAVFETEMNHKVKSDLTKFNIRMPKAKVKIGDNVIFFTLAVTKNIEGQIMQLIKLLQENHIKPLQEEDYA